MRSWKTNLGGSLAAFGHALMGVGVMPQLAGTHSPLLTYIAATGFILSALGTFFTGLFAQDKCPKPDCPLNPNTNTRIKLN